MEMSTLIDQTISAGTTNTHHSKMRKITQDELKARREAKLQKAIEEDRKALKQGLVDRLKSERGMRTIERTFATFDVSKQPKAYHICKDYADNRQMGKGLLIMGNYGTGKTHLVTAIANALLDVGIPALYDTWAGHLQKLKDEFVCDERKYLTLMKRVDILIIDDLGKDKPTEWNNEVLFEVINSRYEHKKPVIITTNATTRELEERNPAVFSRLCEMCDMVIMTGKDYRKGK